MTVLQAKLTAILLALFILALSIFRIDFFTWNIFTVVLFRLLVPFSILVLLYLFCDLIKIRFKPIVLFLIVLELGFISTVNLGLCNQVKSGKLREVIRTIYADYFRRIIVYRDQSGQYDEDLFYTLKPGNFIFDNLEFSTSYAVNSIGLRDSEEDLTQPGIISLGDSFTMGWGVEQDESYPEVLEDKLQRKSLNAAISSYGTAREHLMFQKIDQQNCQLLILQYCSNDEEENEYFIQSDLDFKPSSRKIYQGRCFLDRINSTYYAFKYSFSVFKYGLGVILAKLRPEKATKEIPAIENFHKILQLIRADYTGPIIVFNLESHRTSATIYQQFDSYFKANPEPKLYLFNTAAFLGEEDYFNIDDHLNPKGHQKLAKELHAFIEKHELLQKKGN
jgi:lysophospholipase L1-like esterase